MKKFFSNLLLAVVFFIFSLILFVYAILPIITRQGETVKVPRVTAMQPEAAANKLKNYDLKYEIDDSVYEEAMKANAIVSQDPQPGDKVKIKREINLVVNKEVPPEVKMPSLVNMSFELARYTIETAGLTIGKVTYKPFYADSLVLKQLKAGKTISPGTNVHLTTAIDLVVGYKTDETVLMPDLTNMPLAEARQKINQYQLILNLPKDKYGEVQRQYPYAGTSISKGSLVEIIMNE